MNSAKVYPVPSVSPVVKDFDLFSQLAKAGRRLAENPRPLVSPNTSLGKTEKAGEKPTTASPK
jgi:hypothetical protein